MYVQCNCLPSGFVLLINECMCRDSKGMDYISLDLFTCLPTFGTLHVCFVVSLSKIIESDIYYSIQLLVPIISYEIE